jgi:hypothetical protein
VSLVLCCSRRVGQLTARIPKGKQPQYSQALVFHLKFPIDVVPWEWKLVRLHSVRNFDAIGGGGIDGLRRREATLAISMSGEETALLELLEEAVLPSSIMATMSLNLSQRTAT